MWSLSLSLPIASPPAIDGVLSLRPALSHACNPSPPPVPPTGPTLPRHVRPLRSMCEGMRSPPRRRRAASNKLIYKLSASCFQANIASHRTIRHHDITGVPQSSFWSCALSLFVCLFVHLFVRLSSSDSVRLFDRLFVYQTFVSFCSPFRPFCCVYLCLIRLFIRLFVHIFVRLFVR